MFLFRRLPFSAFSVAFLFPTSKPPSFLSPLLRHNGLMLLPSALSSLRLNRKRRKGERGNLQPRKKREKGGEKDTSAKKKSIGFRKIAKKSQSFPGSKIYLGLCKFQFLFSYYFCGCYTYCTYTYIWKPSLGNNPTHTHSWSSGKTFGRV